MEEPVAPTPLPLDYSIESTARYVRLHSFASPIQADLCLLALQSAGIEARVISQGIDPYGGAVVGGSQLIVQARDAEQANQILEPILAKARARAEARKAKQESRRQCPRCRALRHRVKAKWPSLLMSLLIAFAVALLINLFSNIGILISLVVVLFISMVTYLKFFGGANRRKCAECGTVWQMPEEPDDLDDEPDDEESAPIGTYTATD